MANEDTLGRKIDQTSKDAQYDACAKRLLSEKIVLAFILKYSVSEFSEYPIEDIRDHYIEGVEVAERGVDVDESFTLITSGNEGSAIRGQNVESVTKREGKVTYDIIFDAMIPSMEAPIKFIINVEAQKSESEEYELVTRGIYYCARMISAQKGTVFNKSHYEKMRKVYSIWVCANPKTDRRNTMNEYGAIERNIIGHTQIGKKFYDLWSVVIINLGKKDSTEEKILHFLEVLLSNEREPAEKKDVLLTEYGVDTTPVMDKEMNEMCNLSKGIREEAAKEAAAEERKNILTLMNELLTAGRTEDAKRAANDMTFCQKLLVEFGLAKA